MTTISLRGASLFAQVIGQGYPLALMHGGPGADHISMLAFRPCADQFTLILYDHRCNGRSGNADVSTMTWDNLAADAEALRQTLGFEKWAVLGHSFGGMVALEYALRYPQSLSHLLLVDTCGDTWWVQQNAPNLLAKRGFSPATVETEIWDRMIEETGKTSWRARRGATPEFVAKKAVRAVRKGRREVFPGPFARIAQRGNRLIPSLVAWIVERRG